MSLKAVRERASSQDDGRDPQNPRTPEPGAVRVFLEGAQSLSFTAPGREAAYEWIAAELRRFAYLRLGRGDSGENIFQDSDGLARTFIPAKVFHTLMAGFY